MIYLLESSLCLGVFYIFYRLVLQYQSSYQYNRWYLLLTPLLSFLFPWLEIPVGENATFAPLPPDYILLAPADTGTVQSEEIGFWSWQLALVLVYGLGVVVTLVYYLRHYFTIRRVIQNGKKSQSSSRDFITVNTNGAFPTSSFFNYLLWDNTQDLSPNEEQQILAHEESHICLGHSYDVLYLTLFKIVAWFQPLIYLFDQALAENHEFAADAQAMKKRTFEPTTYNSLLARQTLQTFEPLVNHFYKSKTLKRIKMMKREKKFRWYRYGLVFPVVVLLFTVFSCQQDTAELERQSIQQSHLQAELEWEEIRKLQSDLVAKYFDEHLKEPGNDDLFYQEAKAFQEVATPEELSRYNELREMEKVAWKRKASADTDNIFITVEDQPEPEGGMRLFYDYVQSNLTYPAQARQMGIEGKVFVQFVVDTDGSLTDVKAIKGIGAGCDEEAVRVIQEALPWNPGTQRGKLVKVRMVLPITFRLGEEPNPSAAQSSESSNQFPNMVQVDLKKMVVEPVRVEGGLLKGKVTDREGNPLPGTNILIRGTTTGTVTNMDGEFSISSTQAKDKGLVFAHVGYQTVFLDE
ncbi:MAG: TonB family protein [Bacteroidota bacterium]